MTKRIIALSTFLAFAILQFAVPSLAQHKPKTFCRISVPFESVVGNRVFPAGTYAMETAWDTIGRQGTLNVLSIRSAAGYPQFYQSVVVSEADRSS